MPVEIVNRLEQAGLGKRAVRAIISQGTLEHRRTRGEPLTVEESERALRLASALDLAEAVFGDRDKALEWMTSPKRRFDNETPLELLDTDVGARLFREAASNRSSSIRGMVGRSGYLRDFRRIHDPPSATMSTSTT